MTAAQLVAASILKATGKTSTATSGDTKWTKVLGIANDLIRTWADEPDIDWESLYDPDYSIGTVTATKTFALDTDEVRKLSDKKNDTVRVIHTDGVTYTDYETVPANRLKHFSEGKYCAQIGSNLVFNKAFVATDPQFGGDIQIPIYGYPESLVSDSDDVPVDIPNWLIYRVAAEYVRNDITRQNQYPNLIAEANQLMMKMREANEAQVETVESSWTPPGQTWA